MQLNKLSKIRVKKISLMIFIKVIFFFLKVDFFNYCFLIYKGSLINYVKCLECSYESLRSENFLNLLLTVKNDLDKVIIIKKFDEK